jgi:hypothetical protein
MTQCSFCRCKTVKGRTMCADCTAALERDRALSRQGAEDFRAGRPVIFIHGRPFRDPGAVIIGTDLPGFADEPGALPDPTSD